MRSNVGILRLVRAGVAMGTACAVLAACGSSGGGGDSGTGSGGDGGGAGSALMVDGEQIASADLWSAAKKEGELTLYAATPQSTLDSIVDAFKKDTGLKVNVVRLSGGPLEERVLSEASGHKLGADVINGSDINFANQLEQKKVLQAYAAPSKADIDKALLDPGDLYTPWGIPNMGIAYNSALVKESDAPKSWADLLDPKWRGKLGIFDIGDGGSAWTVALFMRQVLGHNYWQRLAAQKPSVYMGHAPLSSALERGEIEVGTASAAYILQQAKKGSPLKAVFPKEGMAGWPSFLALTAVAKHPAAGKVFINWATSKHGEALCDSISGNYPTNTKVSPPVVNGVTFPAKTPWVPKTSDWLNLRDSWSAQFRKMFGSAS